MLEGIVLGLFAAAILSCALTGHTVIWALIAGFFLFSGYGLFRGHGLKALGAMASKGVRTIMGIVIVMALIGMLTGSWRASGTIARLVTDAAGFITPEWGLLAAFLLNGLLSTLTGTAFGTVATMGVITATMLDAMGVSPLLSGGAILAGVFMGDRCSPVSTSAALVAVVTKTNLYTNLKLMVKTSVVPLLAAGAVYAAIGLLNPGRDAGIDVTGIFRSAFSLHWTTYLPAVVLLALIFLKFSIRLTMVASTLAAVLLCAFVQDMPWRTIGETLVLGFAPEDPGGGEDARGRRPRLDAPRLRDHPDLLDLFGPARGHGPHRPSQGTAARRRAPPNALWRRPDDGRRHLRHRLQPGPARDAHEPALRRGPPRPPEDGDRP